VGEGTVAQPPSAVGISNVARPPSAVEATDSRGWLSHNPHVPYVLKTITEHSSLGLEEDAIVRHESPAALRSALETHSARLGRACYAEQYIDGREFNLSMLASPDGPQVLPPAEIDFSGFPPGKPRLVGYRAKWEEDSFEFQHTPRQFDFSAEDGPLLDRLRQVALSCWRVFGLRGYARVDFRVDRSGQPWVLEINTNPCLSPDAGFYAALQRASLRFEEGIARILHDAILITKQEIRSTK
jgi:D-alanine-D-alanine ligase